MNTPAQLYQPSLRPMPDKLLPLQYPDRFEVPYVSANGDIRWNRKWVNVASAIMGDYVPRCSIVPSSVICRRICSCHSARFICPGVPSTIASVSR